MIVFYVVYYDLRIINTIEGKREDHTIKGVG